ncbi:MAG TPA: hypothetical protein VGC65_12300 [Bacteroidia bacterium]|jgi:hypothetical protein
MKKAFPIFLLLITFSASAQENNRGTIKVQKKGTLYAVLFDNINNRLIGQDMYGNILDSSVVSFTILVTIQGVAYQENIPGNTLSPSFQQKISRVDGGTTLFFSNIKVKDSNNTFADWPKFSSKLGYAYEKEE